MTLAHVDIFFMVVAFLFAISVHESAHAWMADRCGDPTGKELGRISLNPIRHIDPIGTVLLPGLLLFYRAPFLVGWAKPVPVNPLNFRDHVRDDIKTSVVGPVSNFVIAAGAVMLLAVIATTSEVGRILVQARAIGFGIHDVDSLLVPVVLLLFNFIYVNVLLGVFNLIPLPPLDGSHVLRHMLSEQARQVYDNIGVYGLLLFFVFGRPVLWAVLTPVLDFINGLLLRL
jgi:Zn-dependent protease